MYQKSKIILEESLIQLIKKMKKIINLFLLCFCSAASIYGQGLNLQAGGHLVISGNAALVVSDGHFTNNGTFSSGGTGTLYMKGSVPSMNSIIGGNNTTGLQNIVIDKSSNGVKLESNLTCFGDIQMQSGDLNLNGQTIFLFNSAAIQNETGTNRIWGDSGQIILTTNLNAPSNVNPGNMGVVISSTDNLGTFTLYRYHQAQAVNGSSAITRYYKIDYFNTSLTADYTFNYFDSELNGNTEAWLEPWKYQGSWQQADAAARDAVANTIQVNGASTGSDTLWTFSTGQLQVSPKVFLEGNYSGANLMTDRLRTANLIPTTEPYSALGYTQVNSGGETIDPAVLTVSGNNAIVDWVFLEVRNPLDSTAAVQTINALLQADGDIVGLDGVSPVKIPNLADDNYYVAIYHRNHLPIRSASKLALTPVNSSYDYTSALAQAWVHPSFSGNDAMVDLGSGVYGLIGGNVNGNTNVRATGPPFINDFSALLSVLGGSTNILTNQYARADLNLDGTIRATGPPFINDFSKLLNILGSSTAIINAHID